MSMTPSHSVTVVVPVYNGSATLRELASRVETTLSRIAEWELIFVVDGSPDDSWQVVSELVEQCPHVKGIDLFRNFGQHNALLAGIRAAENDVIVTMDDDLQHSPEQIPVLLEAMADDIDLVYGTSP